MTMSGKVGGCLRSRETNFQSQLHFKRPSQRNLRGACRRWGNDQTFTVIPPRPTNMFCLRSAMSNARLNNSRLRSIGELRT